MPVTVFPIAVDSDDGSGWREAATWAGIAAGTFTDSSGSFDDTRISVAKWFDGGNYRVWNAWMRFDTSSIPDAATISSANLLLYKDEGGSVEGGVTFAADYYDFGGEAPTSADWEQSSSGDCISPIAMDTLVDDAVNSIPLTSLSGINKSGYTGIRLAPGNTTEPTNLNFLHFGSEEHASFQEPRLEVTYSVGATTFLLVGIG